MRWLSATDLRQALPMDEAITAMEAAFGDRETRFAPRSGVSLFMAEGLGRHRGKGGVVGSRRRRASSPCSAPTVTRLGWSTVLHSPPSAPARPAGWPPGCWQRLAVLAMLGAGAMAVGVGGPLRPIETVLVWSRSVERAAALAELVESEVAADPDAAVAAADVVCCATPALEPALRSRVRGAGNAHQRRGSLHPGHGRGPSGDDGTLRGG